MGPIGARYPLTTARFVSRYLTPLPDNPPSLMELDKLSPYDFDPREGLQVDGFTLWTVDDLGRPLPAMQEFVRLHGRDLVHGDYHLAVQLAKAPALTDFYCYIRYHQERWRAISVEPGSAFGLKGDRLWQQYRLTPGLVCAGFTRIRPDINGGIELEDGVLFEAVFHEKPFEDAGNLLDQPPDGPDNKPRNFTAYIEPARLRGENNRLGDANPHAGMVTLYWEETNLGDTNNDGEVGLGDLTPIGRRYGRMSTDASEDEWDRLPDANGDGEVNYHDQFAIEDHFGALLSGYRLYRRPEGASAGGLEDILLPHRNDPLLPLSIHRPLAWDPILPVEYRFIDVTLPDMGETARWVYRIVPYNARTDVEAKRSVLEVEIEVGASGVRVIHGGETSPRIMRTIKDKPKMDATGREVTESWVKRE
jgi:hypothetical protein